MLKLLVALDYKITLMGLYEWACEMMPREITREVLGHFEKLLVFDHRHARARYLAGVLAARAGDVQRSRVHLEDFIELAPSDSRAAAARYILDSLGSPVPDHRQ